MHLQTPGAGSVFIPFDDARYFFPWRPLETSPVSPAAFFRGRALEILANEVVWVWLPVGLVWLGLRRPTRVRNQPSA